MVAVIYIQCMNVTPEKQDSHIQTADPDEKADPSEKSQTYAMYIANDVTAISDDIQHCLSLKNVHFGSYFSLAT